MADTNPQKLIGLEELNSYDRQRLSEATTREARAAVINTIEREKGNRSGAVFSPETREYIEKIYAAQRLQQNQPPPPSALSSFGNLAGAFGIGSLAVATADTSKSWEVIAHTNSRQLDEMFGEHSDYDDVGESGNISDEQLDSLSSSTLSGSQYQALEDRIRDAGASDEDIKNLRHNFDEQVRERESQRTNPNKSRRQRDREAREEKEESERRKRLREALQNVGKEEEKRGKKLSPEEIQRRRKAILRQYASGQQRKNNPNLERLLSRRRLLGLGRKSTLQGSVKKRVVASVRKEQKVAREELKKLRKAAKIRKLPSLPLPEGFEDAESSFLPTASNTPSGSPLPQGSGPSSIRLPIPGLGSGVAKKLLFSNPYVVWAILGAILLIVVIIIIVLIIANAPGCKLDCPIPLTQLSCGNTQYLAKVGSGGEEVFNETKSFFQIDFRDMTSVQKDGKKFYNGKANESVARALYGIVCILSGESAPGSIKADFNNFWYGVTSHNDGSGSYTPPIIHLQQNPTVTDSANRITCAGNYGIDPLTGNYNSDNIYIYNPEKCVSPSGTTDNPASFALPKLQFVVGKTLATAFLYNNVSQFNPTYFSGSTADMVQEFTTNVTLFHGINALPSYSCASTVGTPNFVDNCFTDMVGEYLTYPTYLDTAGENGFTQPFPNPFPQAAPAAGLTPNLGLIFSNYKSDPNYGLYYTFAFKNLFNQSDFFIGSRVINSCPTATPSDVPSLINAIEGWGFQVTGDDLSGKKSMLQDDFLALCLALQSPKYAALLSVTQSHIGLNFSDLQGGGGFTEQNLNGFIVHIYGPHEGEHDYNKFTIMHELGHVLADKHGDLYALFLSSVYNNTPTLPTLNCQHDYDRPGIQGPYPNECWADMIGEYLTYPTWSDWAPESLANYPTGKYANYYYFAYKNIFGETSFFDTSFRKTPDGLAAYSKTLVNILANCGHSITASTLAGGCLNLLPSQNKTAVTQYIKKAVNDNGVLECVGFAEAATIGVGQDIGTRNAAEYALQPLPIPGYSWIPYSAGDKFVFKPGDIFIQYWGKRPVEEYLKDYLQDEHIAIVTSVSPDGSIIEVSQGNSDGAGHAEVVSRNAAHEMESLLGVHRINN